MKLVEAYKYIAIKVGDYLKYECVLRDIDHAQQIVMSSISIENFPNDTITSVRQKKFYNMVLSLAKSKLAPDERDRMLSYVLI